MKKIKLLLLLFVPLQSLLIHAQKRPIVVISGSGSSAQWIFFVYDTGPNLSSYANTFRWGPITTNDPAYAAYHGVNGVGVSWYSTSTSDFTPANWKLSSHDVPEPYTKNRYLQMYNAADDNSRIKHGDFNQYKATTHENWFANMKSVTHIINPDHLNLSSSTNINNLFYHCEGLLGSRDSNGNYDSKNCLNVTAWNWSNLTGTMTRVFDSCYKLKYIWLPANNSITNKVTGLTYIFNDCKALVSISNISNWNTSNVTSLEGLFQGCENLRNTTAGQTYSEGIEVNLTNWTTSKVTNMSKIFMNCKAVTNINLSNWNTTNVTNMGEMFKECNNLTTLTKTKNTWTTSKVTNMYATFMNCYKLASLDVSNWTTSGVTNMSQMFYNCQALAGLTTNGWRTPIVTNMYGMFYNCYKLASLDVSNWATPNVTNTAEMFRNCRSLPSLDVRNFDTKQVTNMENMFRGCTLLTSLTFGENFSTEKNPSKNYMFAECPKLRYLDFYDSDHTAAITSVEKNSENNMFSGVPATTVIYLPKKNATVTNKTNVVYSFGGDEAKLRCPYYYSSDPMNLSIPSGFTHSQAQTDIEIPRSFQTNEAVYVRTMPTGATIGTAILPYEFASNDSIQAYKLVKEGNFVVRFESTNSIPANMPFVFKVKKSRIDGTAHFRTYDATGNFGITVYRTVGYSEEGKAQIDTDYFETDYNYNGWTARGYYVAQTGYENDYSNVFYINKAGTKFCQATGPLTLNPHRVTFHGNYAYGSGGAKTFGIEFTDIPTAIEEAEMRETVNKSETVYNLQGRKVEMLNGERLNSSTLPKGIHIIRMSDGAVKKVIIK